MGYMMAGVFEACMIENASTTRKHGEWKGRLDSTYCKVVVVPSINV